MLSVIIYSIAYLSTLCRAVEFQSIYFDRSTITGVSKLLMFRESTNAIPLDECASLAMSSIPSYTIFELHNDDDLSTCRGIRSKTRSLDIRKEPRYVLGDCVDRRCDEDLSFKKFRDHLPSGSITPLWNWAIKTNLNADQCLTAIVAHNHLASKYQLPLAQSFVWTSHGSSGTSECQAFTQISGKKRQSTQIGLLASPVDKFGIPGGNVSCSTVEKMFPEEVMNRCHNFGWSFRKLRAASLGASSTERGDEEEDDLQFVLELESDSD